MAARLLETGLLEPSELLEKLSQEKAAFHSTDQININKDGSRKKATYYQHLHLLFSLFHLSEQSQTVLRNLALIPSLSIPMRLFAHWISLPNLNDINDLIELGLVQVEQGCVISLHPMIGEIALVDMAPSCQNCQPLLCTLQLLCLRHGETISYYKTIFQAIASQKLGKAFLLLTVSSGTQTPYYYKADGKLEAYIRKTKKQSRYKKSTTSPFKYPHSATQRAKKAQAKCW